MSRSQPRQAHTVSLEPLSHSDFSAERQRSRWARGRSTLISVAVSAALLISLYLSVDIKAVGTTLRSARGGWLIVSLAMIIPITVFRAMRFAWVAPPGSVSGLGEALRLTLVASAFNMFVPTKAGDLVKSLFVAKRGGASTSVSVAVVIYERLSDLFGLTFWCLAAWLLKPPLLDKLPSLAWVPIAAVSLLCGVLTLSGRAAELSLAFVQRFLSHRKLKVVRNLVEGWPGLHEGLVGRRSRIALFSIFLWLVQVTQIWLFAVTINVSIPFFVCVSLSAVAFMAAQLPFTFNGLGTRDVALVLLFSGYTTAEAAAAMGVLTVTRGLFPALAALPIIRPYVSAVADAKRELKKK